MTTPKNTTDKPTGIKRIVKATGYSASGLSFAIKHETAFRQEFLLSLFMLPVLLFLPIPIYLKWLLFSAHFVVMITEIINSSIESVVDLVSPEHHQLAGRAKDLGSAAVLLALTLTGTLWLYALYLTIR